MRHILPLRLLHILNFEFYRNWRDQRPQFKFVYQFKPNERLVEKPTSHDRVVTCLQEWPSYAHLEYFESWSKLKTFTTQKLKHKGASWHRECSSGVRTPSKGSYIAIAHRFSSKRETARCLYGNA